MPKITTYQYPLGVVADSLDPPQIRKPGWHVSNLIHEAIAISKGKRAEPFTADNSGLMAWGRMWEAAVRPWVLEYASLLGYEVVLPSQQEPLEVNRDGIIGNLDGEIRAGGVPIAVLETKATTGESDPLQKEAWLHQVKAYCYDRQITQAWFMVLHMPRRAAPSAGFYLHVVDFDPAETQYTWTMLLNTKSYLEGLGECH